jgi:hypothetical protein
MRPAGRGVVIASLGASGLPAFLVDDLFAFADTFNVRGSFPFSHNDASFPSSSCRTIYPRLTSYKQRVQIALTGDSPTEGWKIGRRK